MYEDLHMQTTLSVDEAQKHFSVEPGYLDTASNGAPPDAVVDAMTSAITTWSLGRARPQDYDACVTESRAAFARMVHVHADDVAIGNQVSPLMGLVAASLPDNARVVGAKGDFTSALFPFLAQGSRGVETTLVALDRIAESIDNRTNVVVVSAVQSADGTVADLEAIRTAASTHEALTVLDTTHTYGWLPIDASRFDITICAAYKWLLSPRGTAFMTVRREHLDWIRPLSAGWYAGEDIWSSIYDGPLRLAGNARRFDVSPAWLCWVGTAPALALINRVGVEAIHAHNVGLANRVRLGLGLPTSNSAIVRLESSAAPDLLQRADLRASIRAGAVRMSFHLYNTEEDADRVLEVLNGADIIRP